MKMTNHLKILVVEDDDLFSLGLKVALSSDGVVQVASSKQQAFELMAKEIFDLAIIDMDYHGRLEGPEVVERAVANGIYTVVLSGNDLASTIELAYAKGAKDYVPKLGYVDHLKRVLTQYREQEKSLGFSHFAETFFLTRNSKTLQELASIPLLKGNQKNVFVSGATGTGKGLVAQMIHHYQGLPPEKFVALNCSALGAGLLESELFGHEKGSFTGAQALHRGKLEQADGGTLFLDEVATMSMDLQAKLLKALEEKCFYRVGGTKLIKANFRVVSATWENILEMIQKNKFRPDLYFRLSGLSISLPGLKDRPEDLWPLVRLFMHQEGRMLAFSASAKKVFENHSWPGNVRELKKCIETLCLTKRGVVEASDLNSLLNFKTEAQLEREVVLGQGQIHFIEQHGLPVFIEEIEKMMVAISRKNHAGKVRAVLKELKISSTTYYRIAEELDLSKPSLAVNGCQNG